MTIDNQPATRRSGAHTGLDPLGELGEFGDVLLALEGPRAQRMRVGDRELVGDDVTVLEGDDGLGAERLLGGIGGVIATGPLRVFDGGDLAPQLDRVGPVRALGRVRPFVMPGAVLQSDGEDVHHRVVQGLP